MADIDKRMTLKEAVAKFIHDGDVVYYGGFQIMVPMALTHEIIRQKKRHLTTIESSTDVGGLDLLVGAGCVSEIHSAWIMNWYVKAPYAIRRAFNKGHLKRYDISNFGATTAMMAGFMGIPFMPVRSLLGSDVAGREALTQDERTADPRTARKKLHVMDSPFDPADRVALGILGELFTDRPVVGIHAVELVWGLGTLHCLTQQQPAVEGAVPRA